MLNFSDHPVNIEGLRMGILLWDFQQNISDLCPLVSYIQKEGAKYFHSGGSQCLAFSAHPTPASSGSRLSLCPQRQCAEPSVFPQHPVHATLTRSFVINVTVGQSVLTDTETSAIAHVSGRSKEQVLHKEKMLNTFVIKE